MNRLRCYRCSWEFPSWQPEIFVDLPDFQWEVKCCVIHEPEELTGRIWSEKWHQRLNNKLGNASFLPGTPTGSGSSWSNISIRRSNIDTIRRILIHLQPRSSVAVSPKHWSTWIRLQLDLFSNLHQPAGLAMQLYRTIVSPSPEIWRWQIHSQAV